MDFNSFIQLIAKSTVTDWNVITCWGAGAGPSYKSRFEFNNLSAVSVPGFLKEESHSMYACFKDEISISLAFGLEENGCFIAPWTTNFCNSSASSKYLDLFFSGALVHRISYVGVDGGRAKLPIPLPSAPLSVDANESALIRLIDRFESLDGNYDDYFRRAGFSER